MTAAVVIEGVFQVDFRPSTAKDGDKDWPATLPHGSRLVIVFRPENPTKGKVRFFEPFAVRTHTLSRRLFDRLTRTAPVINPRRMAARIDERRRCLKRHGLTCADDTARAIVAALKKLAP